MIIKFMINTNFSIKALLDIKEEVFLLIRDGGV
jgi:hypothetical protein